MKYPHASSVVSAGTPTVAAETPAAPAKRENMASASDIGISNLRRITSTPPGYRSNGTPASASAAFTAAIVTQTWDCVWLASLDQKGRIAVAGDAAKALLSARSSRRLPAPLRTG
jgi:hypothetical protein